MDAQDFRSLQEAYLDVYGEGYKSFPYEKVREKEKKIMTDRASLGKKPLTGKSGSEISDTLNKLEKSRNRATSLSLQTSTAHSEAPKRKEKSNRNRPESEKRSKTVEPQKSFGNRLTRSDRQGIRDSYEYDLYDLILSHLLDEGYADTEEAAERIMVNMSENWRESIVETRMDPRGRPASGPMNVYANSKGKPSQAHLDAVKSYDAEQKKKTPEQRKKELDDYRERQMNNK